MMELRIAVPVVLAQTMRANLGELISISVEAMDTVELNECKISVTVDKLLDEQKASWAAHRAAKTLALEKLRSCPAEVCVFKACPNLATMVKCLGPYGSTSYYPICEACQNCWA